MVAAPTGSGKTVLHELAIVRLLITASLRPNKLKYNLSVSIYLQSVLNQVYIFTRNMIIRAVVIAPNKALCQQRVAEWSATFGPVGLTVIELTGDNSLVNGLQSLTRSNIVVTTPEKWDAITRGWRKHM